MMREWNIVLSLNEHGFKDAFKKLGRFGPIRKTGFFNVLFMRVDDIHRMIETLRKWTDEDPQALSFLSRLIPVTDVFSFQTPGEFEEKARKIALSWVPELTGKGFHVRIHRRGFKGRLSGLEEEHFLDKILLEALEKTGNPGHITFEDPDAIIAVETIGTWAGLLLWTREELQRYPFIRLD
jgi:tRNA(Ser,Leu) C12 N-acetylase TAN1